MHALTSQHLYVLITGRSNIKPYLCPLSAARNLYRRPEAVSDNGNILPVSFLRAGKLITELKPLRAFVFWDRVQ